MNDMTSTQQIPADESVSVEEAKRMFAENPGLSSVLTNEGVMFRDGTFEHSDPHLKMIFPHINPPDNTPADRTMDFSHVENHPFGGIGSKSSLPG